MAEQAQCALLFFPVHRIIVPQWLRSKIDPFVPTRHINRTEIKPGKDPGTRIQNKAVGFGQRPRPLHPNQCVCPLGDGRCI